jgi:hypothetical protein
MSDIIPLCPVASYVNDKYNVSLDEPDSDEERDEDNEEEDDGPFDTMPLYYKSPEKIQESEDFTFTSRMLYYKHLTGEPNNSILQALQYLSKKKSEVETNVRSALSHNSPIVKPFLKKWYILLIELQGITLPISRTVRVRGSSPLSMLQDKIIAPAFGWNRGMSPYIFRAGLHSYPSQKRPALDSFSCSRASKFGIGEEHGRGSRHKIDDSIVCVADLLHEKDQKIIYIHDFKMYGDKYELNIVVQDIVDEDSYTKPGLIAGQGACLPEKHVWDFDGDLGEEIVYSGVHAYAITIDRLNCGDHRWKERAEDKLYKQSYNNDLIPRPFNPNAFDLKATEKRVSKALNSKISKGMDLDPMLMLAHMTSQYGSDTLKERVMAPTKCFNCQKSEGELKVKMKQCSQCKNARYCGSSCQKQVTIISPIITLLALARA